MGLVEAELTNVRARPPGPIARGASANSSASSMV